MKECGTITDVNLVSLEEADQTYTVDCGNETGDTVRVEGAVEYQNFAEIRIYTPEGIGYDIFYTSYKSPKSYVTHQ